MDTQKNSEIFNFNQEWYFSSLPISITKVRGYIQRGKSVTLLLVKESIENTLLKNRFHFETKTKYMNFFKKCH